jgi:DNA repair photolyase
LEAAVAASAGSASYVLLRLPFEIKDLFREWLEAHVPGKANHVLELIRDMHGGALYDSEFGKRMRGEGPYAELLRRRFQLACKRLGLNANRERWSLEASLFRPPPRPGDQHSLL